LLCILVTIKYAVTYPEFAVIRLLQALFGFWLVDIKNINCTVDKI
jgi:hypothetical protein